MANFYDRLGDILKDRLDSDEDPFDAWDPQGGKTRTAGGFRERKPPPKKDDGDGRVPVPQELIPDFLALGLQPGVSLAACKAAWKRLLHRHHPDRHAGDPKGLEAATAASIKLTESWRRISRWFQTGSTD